MPSRLVEEGQRRRLVEALVTVVGEVGYEAAKPDQIAATAGVPVGRFRALFGRKSVCFVAGYDAEVRRLLSRVERAAGRPVSPQAQLESGIAALLRWCEEEPRAARLCIVEVFAAGPVAGRRREATMRALAVALEPPLHLLRPTERLAQLGSRAVVGAAHELMYEALERGRPAGLSGLAGELAAEHGDAVAA
jgi:AcrR family transcriptional regulator